MNKQQIIFGIVIVVVAVGLSLLLGGTSTIKEITNNLGAVSNIFDVGSEMGQNGLQQVVVSGSFSTASTTFVTFEVPIPKGASGTLDFLSLRMDGRATSTFDFYCGPAATSTRNILTTRFMSVGMIATSTNFGVVASGVATSTANGQVYGASYLGDGATLNKVGVTGGSNVSCVAEATANGTAFSIPSSTFSGVFKAIIRYAQ